MALTYSLSVVFQPEQAGAGESLQATVELSNVEGAVKNVYISVPEYDIWLVAQKAEENKYTVKSSIPYDAPVGDYQVQIYAVDPNNQRGPVTYKRFTVTG